MNQSRLKPMPKVYDEKLFLELFKNTEKLRNKLAYEIDSKRFGLSTEDIRSEFDAKFIHAFTKYHDNKPKEFLKAYIIQSLMYFKVRLIKKAYTHKALAMLEQANIEEAFGIGELPEELQDEERRERVERVKSFFKSKLSKQAFDVFLATLYPPDYITHKNIDNPKAIHRVSNEDLSDFFGITLKEVERCKREIRNTTKRARLHLA